MAKKQNVVNSRLEMSKESDSCGFEVDLCLIEKQDD